MYKKISSVYNIKETRNLCPPLQKDIRMAEEIELQRAVISQLSRDEIAVVLSHTLEMKYSNFENLEEEEKKKIFLT